MVFLVFLSSDSGHYHEKCVKNSVRRSFGFPSRQHSTFSASHAEPCTACIAGLDACENLLKHSTPSRDASNVVWSGEYCFNMNMS